MVESEIFGRATFGTQPELWAGPSVALVARARGESVLALSGYFARLAEWEQRFQSQSESRSFGLTFSVDGSSEVLQDSAPWSAARLEIILDHPHLPVVWPMCDEPLTGALSTVVSAVLSRPVTEALLDLPPIGSNSISSNRSLGPSASLAGMHVADLRLSSLPARNRHTIPLIYASRWVRIVRYQQRSCFIWDVPEGQWGPEVRWPHNVIPSFNSRWLVDGYRTAESGDRLIGSRILEIIGHSRYFVATLGSELEHWEEGLFARMSQGVDVFDKLELHGIQEELGHLANYLSRSRVDLKAFRRRSRVESKLFDSDNERIQQELNFLGADLERERENLRGAFALLSAAATGDQLRAAQVAQEEARAAQEFNRRTQDTILIVSALLLAPSLVVAVYGSNVRQLVSGGRGDIWSLFAWTVFAAMATTATFVVAAFRRRDAKREAVLLAVGLLVPLFLALLAALLLRGPLAAASAVAVASASFLLLRRSVFEVVRQP